MYRKKRYTHLKNKTDLRFVLEKVREDKGVEMPETIVLLPNQTNLIEISIKDMKAIDKKSFHATYKV